MIENFAYGEINEQSFSNPHPSSRDHTVSADESCWGRIWDFLAAASITGLITLMTLWGKHATYWKEWLHI